MSELDPAAQWKRESRARLTPISPETARLIVWGAGGRIMADKNFSPRMLYLAEQYLGVVLKDIDEMSATAEVMRNAGEDEPKYSFGNSMKWGEIGLCSTHLADDAPNSIVPGIHEDVARTVELVKGHLGDAYVTFENYQQAQQQGVGDASVNWH